MYYYIRIMVIVLTTAIVVAASKPHFLNSGLFRYNLLNFIITVGR